MPHKLRGCGGWPPLATVNRSHLAMPVIPRGMPMSSNQSQNHRISPLTNGRESPPERLQARFELLVPIGHRLDVIAPALLPAADTFTASCWTPSLRTHPGCQSSDHGLTSIVQNPSAEEGVFRVPLAGTGTESASYERAGKRAHGAGDQPDWRVGFGPLMLELRAAGQPLGLPHAVAGPLRLGGCRPAAPAPQRAWINVPPPLGGGPPRGSAEPRGVRWVGSLGPGTRVRRTAGPPAAALPVRPVRKTETESHPRG